MIRLLHFSLLQARLQTGRLNQHIAILLVGGHVIGGGFVALMCRSHLQSGCPQRKDMLANSTDNHPGHPLCDVVLLVIVQFASCHLEGKLCIFQTCC